MINWSNYNKFRREFSADNSFHKISLKTKSSFDFASEKTESKSVLDFGASDGKFGKFCKSK